MEAAVLIGLVFLLVTFVLPIASWLSSRRTRARVDAMYEALVGEARAVELLKEQVAELREKLRLLERPAPIAAEPPAQPFVVKPAPPPPPAVVKPPEPVPTAPPTPVAPPIPPTPPAPAALPPAPTPRPPSPPPLPPVPVEEPSGWLGAGFDWENLVGVKLFSAIAGIALVFAAVFFLRYSMEHGWLQPPVRVLIGIMVAVGLLVACEMKAARKYPVTANALDAAAIAILFSTFFAAHALWNLIPTSIAFGLLAMVTALAVLLSIRHESLFIALLGLLGGFATPALLSTGENRPIPLFAYLLLLNIGLAWVAHRRTWPVLSVLTLVFTTIYQWGWVIRFLRDASDVSLAMGIFLIFPLVTVAGVLLARRPTLDEAASDADTTFERTALVAAAVPLVFGVYLAAVPAYGARASLLFGFVFLLDAGLFAIAVARRQMFLHSVAAGTTLITMAIWLAVSYVSDARVVTLAFTAGFVLFFLLAPIAVEAGFSRPVDATVEDGFRRPAGKLAEYTAPLLLFVLAALARLEPAFVTPWLLFATLLVLLLACAWRAIATQDGYIYYIAAFLAVAAQALWSVEHLALERLAAAVSIFATFGIASMAIPLTARRLGRPLQPAEGGGLVLLASLILLLYLSSGPIAPAALWALALLLAILNAGLFVESAGARMPALSIAGSLLSWMILGVWWMRAAGSVGVLPSLTVLIGLTLLTLAGHAWSYDDDRRVPANSLRSLLASGLWLGLGGHLFLFVLAMNREWALPPWPLFGALAVMTFATSVAAAYSRTPVLHAAGIGAAALVVAAWTAASAAMPWTTIGLAAGAAVSAYALGWIPLFRRSGSSEVASIGAAAALVTGELTAMIAGAAPQQPAVTALVAAHVANVAILLALTWARRWRHVAIVVAVIAYAAVVGWRAPWQHQLALSGALYLTIVAYPLLLGARARGDRDPYIAAIVASAMFFFAGRAALEAGGYEWMIGALPVAEAVVMAVLLRQLLRMETVAERDLGRLALVAGSALALITIAIPLQLDHQWITIGWALEGAALAWLFTRVPHRGLLYSSLALLGAVFVRLALNPEVYRYEPRGELRVFNWYLYSYLLAAASLLVAARWFSRTDARLLNGRLKAAHLLPAAAVVLLFLLLNIEIADFYATGPEITFRFGAGVSQDLTYTIGWLVFGMLLLAAGIYWRTRPARVTAVALIAVTAFKCFLYDLGSLGGLYRVGSFVGLAVALALVSLALQKYVLARPKETA